MSNSTKTNPIPQFLSLKFNFSFIKKFITMDLHMKATIDDLKPTFANLLNINFFAKKLTYYYKNVDLKTWKTMQELIEDGEISREDVTRTRGSSESLVLEVRQEEEGA